MHTGPNIVNDGLVFGMDTGYGVANNNTSTRHSKGKPTTNSAHLSFDSTFETFSDGNTVGFSNQLGSGNYLGVSSEKSYNGTKSLKTIRGSGNRIFRTTSISSGQYTSFSCWVYSETSGPYLTLEYFGGDYSWGVTQTRNYHSGTGWEYLFVRSLSPATSNTTCYYFLYPNTSSPVYWDNIQVENNQYPSPHAKSTRSSTQSLIDLTRTRNINVSNVSFDSVGQPILDGTDDFIDLGTDVTFKSSGGWTVESMVKYNSVAGGYNNVTSPANFIGSDSILHNSWYWSVLSGKLALWNRSPGTWRYGSTTLQTDTWYHVVLVCQDNGTTYQMYLNGVPEGGDHTTYSWNNQYSGLIVRYVGRGNSGNQRRVNGSIPITKIYNRVLTEQEIKQNYSAYKKRFN